MGRRGTTAGSRSGSIRPPKRRGSRWQTSPAGSGVNSGGSDTPVSSRRQIARQRTNRRATSPRPHSGRNGERAGASFFEFIQNVPVQVYIILGSVILIGIIVGVIIYVNNTTDFFMDVNESLKIVVWEIMKVLIPTAIIWGIIMIAFHRICPTKLKIILIFASCGLVFLCRLLPMLTWLVVIGLIFLLLFHRLFK